MKNEFEKKLLKELLLIRKSLEEIAYSMKVRT